MPEAWPTLNPDKNADGHLSLTDVWLWLVQVFLMPGDAVLWLILTYTPGFARFAELDVGDYGGFFVAVASAAAWILAFLVLGTVYGAVMDLDRALTAQVRAWYREWLRRVRVARRWLVCELRRLRMTLAARGRPTRRNPDVDLAEIEISELELEILRSHALLAPGYVMSASDLAGTLEIRRTQASQLLARLEKLTLLQRSFSTDEGESGYRLSESGHFVLTARGRHDE